MLLINIGTLQSHYLRPFYPLNPLKISLERPKKLNRNLDKEHTMDTLRLSYKSNVTLIYRDSIEKSNLQNFFLVGRSVSLSGKKIYRIVWGSFNEIQKIKVFTVH